MKTFICYCVVLLVGIGHGQDLTQTEEKPGICPEVGILVLGRCDKECNTDNDCLQNLKCCQTGCDGLECKIPDAKPGICPSHNVTVESCESQNTCRSDANCEGNLKCCPRNCGSSYCESPEETKVTASP
ncbi:WAP four-disulfide core domain protein 2 [Bombina bombina]|uniref:WAP four-disulfide core domain protein 2 n=1 Tax=Bombina bombina TaxID=8345 RepID=UPI00235ADC30|nr:WAP four-disulfide core domain protein 2 [Bombina bombina]